MLVHDLAYELCFSVLFYVLSVFCFKTLIKNNKKKKTVVAWLCFFLFNFIIFLAERGVVLLKGYCSLCFQLSFNTAGKIKCTAFAKLM